MATLSRLLLVILVASVVLAADDSRTASDTTRADTLALSALDSTSAREPKPGAWYLPLVVIAATGGLFVLLFTTRSK